MIKKSHLFILTTLLMLIAYYSSLSKENFYLDAVVFNSNDSTEGRIDVYVIVPNETLSFEKLSDNFIANIDLHIELTSDGDRVDRQRVKKTITSSNYEESQGVNGEFNKYFFRFSVNSGSYNVEAKLVDELNGKKFSRNREVTVIDFNSFDFSVSGILLVSQIEELDGKYKITPYISDNIGNLEDNFFAFFEVYNKNEQRDIKLQYKLLKNGDIEAEGELKEVSIPIGNTQQFLNINLSKLNLSGEYTLQIIAYKEVNGDLETIAITQRSIKHEQNLYSFATDDIDKAIKMLRYVANDETIDKLESIKGKDEKEERFRMFWKDLDPTPNTSFNEAMNEYYQRIKYANEQFKSYSDGWLTDMGMVFVVMGPPMSVEKQSSFGNNIQYRVWVYPGNRTFLFADRNGFGNYRLERPYLFNEKYEYRN
ncbi:MAG: GWxTD domain-containing protein [Chlorobiota bacterium]